MEQINQFLLTLLRRLSSLLPRIPYWTSTKEAAIQIELRRIPEIRNLHEYVLNRNDKSLPP